MKNLVLTLLLTSIYFIGFSQEQAPKNEFGLNATGFVANYFNLGGVSSNTPYLIDYKRKLVPGLYLRSGLDFGFRNNNTSQQNGNRFYSSTKRVNLRIGVEKRKPLGAKFEWHYGLDAIGGLNFTESTSHQQFFSQTGIVSVKSISGNESSSIGLGPVAGLRWNVSPRISLWTEARSYFIYNELKILSRWEDVPDDLFNQNPGLFDTKSRTDYNANLNFFVPLDLYVSFKF
jgi:hypothetical protein